jgi:NAD(P)-dependent dehydrogenase (short-subunit alcohol dehydrogenase family)
MKTDSSAADASAPVCIVTGAFGALGRVVADTLARRGLRMALLDAAGQVPGALAESPGVFVLPNVDLTDEMVTVDAVQQVLEQFGRLDALVNVAGGFRWETVAEGSAATWDRLYTLNVKTALHTCRAALPALKAAGRGRIVNIGAGAAVRAGLGMGAYAASKAGVQRLSEALAEELKDQHITVNTILPSIIDTPANRADMPDADASRWVQPASIAEVVAFLLSPAAQDVTGAAIAINGRV